MKTALMQPYFFPYLGYFQLIHSVDEFVIFDQAQHIRRNWITRNRILSPHKETVYINIPVSKASRETKIKDIHIDNDFNWQEKIVQQLLYYKEAPNYIVVMKLLNEIFSVKFDFISQFNIFLLKETCSFLNIRTNITVLSEKFPEIVDANEADEWGIKVSQALNATTYINAIGGKEFYNQEKYNSNGLDIQFINPILNPYKQVNNHFVPALSIIDVMMFNNTREVMDMIEEYSFVK